LEAFKEKVIGDEQKNIYDYEISPLFHKEKPKKNDILILEIV